MTQTAPVVNSPEASSESPKGRRPSVIDAWVDAHETEILITAVIIVVVVMVLVRLVGELPLPQRWVHF